MRTSPRHGDPIDELSHDHGPLSALLLAVREVLDRILESGGSHAEDAGELRDGVESLRESLLVHFAREEEALFPFVVARFPAMRARAESLTADHEVVCRRAEDLARVVERSLASREGFAGCRAALDSFEEAYARHTQNELALLDDVDALLDSPARGELRTLLSST